MTIFFIVFTLCWFLIGALIVLVSIISHDGEMVAPGLIILIIVITLNFIPILDHVNDLAYLRNADAFIQTYREAIQEIDKQLTNVSLPPAALLNADTPIAQLIKTKSEFVKKIAEEKLKRVKTKTKIQARSMGPSAWVVWVYGEE